MTNEQPNTRAGEALKPCPFCGAGAFLRSPMLPMLADCDDVQVSCENCDASGPPILFDQDAHGETDLPELEAEAITAWNTRPLPQPSELVERAKKRIKLGKMTGSHTGSRLNIYQIAEELLTQIAKLQARLEVVPGWSEDADGIACRNDTIKLQDECIAKLQADGDKLAVALRGLVDSFEKHRPKQLWDNARQALTEWKDPKNA